MIADFDPEFAATPDYYRLAYAIGVFDGGASGNGNHLTPGCVNRCCDQPAAALGLHLAHVADKLHANPLVTAVLATVDGRNLPKQTVVVDQGMFWLGYYHGRSRKYYKGRIAKTPRNRPKKTLSVSPQTEAAIKALRDRDGLRSDSAAVDVLIESGANALGLTVEVADETSEAD